MSPYEVSLELEPLRGSEHFGECVGLFVLVYVPAVSIRDALERSEAWARTALYSVLDIDRCVRIELDHYEPHDSNYPSAEALSSALGSGEVHVGTFHVYESQSEH